MIFANRNYLFLFAAIVVLFGLYCFNPFELYFQNDDFVHIPLSAEGKIFQHNSFRPVCDLSVMLDYFLWKKNAVGYHFTNLIIHIFDCFLFFVFCKNVFRKYRVFENVFEVSILTSLLFFIYPNHSEAVFWILGRSASLGVLFFLLSLIFYLKRDKTKYFLLSILFAIVAWLTYESTWILVVIFIIISFVDSKLKTANFKSELNYFLLFAFCFLLYLLARFYFIHEVVGAYEGNNFFNLNVSVLASNYFKIIMRSWLPSFENPVYLISTFICIATLLIISILKIKNKTQQRFFVCILSVWLVSLLTFASLGIDTKGTESERFLYLPSVFICIAIIFLINKIRNIFFREAILIVVFTMQIFFLFVNAQSYRFAGNIVRTTIEEINKIKVKENLYVENLPEQNHGALIFRVGFFEALNWMKNGKSIDSVFIISRQETEQKFCRNYKVEHLDSLPETAINSAFEENKKNSNEYKHIIFPSKLLIKKNAFFRFTDSSLITSY